MENAALGLIRGPPCLSLLSVKLSSSQAFGSEQGGDGAGDRGDGGDGSDGGDGGDGGGVVDVGDGEGLGTVIDANSYKGPEN